MAVGEVWGHENIEQVATFHCYFLARELRIKIFAPKAMTYEGLGLQ